MHTGPIKALTTLQQTLHKLSTCELQFVRVSTLICMITIDRLTLLTTTLSALAI